MIPFSLTPSSGLIGTDTLNNFLLQQPSCLMLILFPSKFSLLLSFSIACKIHFASERHHEHRLSVWLYYIHELAYTHGMAFDKRLQIEIIGITTNEHILVLIHCYWYLKKGISCQKPTELTSDEDHSRAVLSAICHCETIDRMMPTALLQE